MDDLEAKYCTEITNDEQNLRSSNLIDSIERNEKVHRRTNKNSQKKRVVKNKKKKKINKVIDSSNEVSLNPQKDTPKNPYRIFLLYKLRKKYDVKMHVYDMKKVNELIFNIPSHFTAIFKEYLLKEEEAEFLKRIYHKNELNKKLKNIFYFYEKYSKIFPNYIVIPEGHYLYRNILKKQKMIDKLQRMKEEENKNKKKLLELSFNTIFTNGAIDSIYSNNNVDPLNNLSNIISMDSVGKNEEQELIQIQNIIKNIENHENIIGIKDMKSLDKKQIIYKKEFRNLRSLSKSTFLQNGREIRGKSKESDRKKNFPDNKNEKYIGSQTRTKEKKRKNKIYKYSSPNTKRNETKESDDENENQNDSISIRMSKKMIEESVKNNKDENEDKNLKNKYKRIKKSKERDSKNEDEEKYEKYRTNEDESSKRNKKKKFIVLRGNRHYFIKNRETEEKSSDYTNDEKNLTYKSKNLIDDEKEIFYSKHYKINKNNNSFSQNKNLRKDDSIKNHQNFILYKKKLCNGSRGLSISKKNNENEANTNHSRRMYRINTNFTTNGAKITPVRKYLVNEQQNISTKRQGENNLPQDKWKKIMNENNERPSNYFSQNFQSSTYTNNNNLELTYQNKNNDTLNGNSSNIYHKKYKIDNLRNSYMDKSCPKNYNKFLTDMEVNKKKEYANNNYSNEDKSNDQSNNEGDNNNNHRYYRTSQHNNNKKFKLRAPKNYYKIDLD